jgi:Putative Flp pilus-assembly TadE/G-like
VALSGRHNPGLACHHFREFSISSVVADGDDCRVLYYRIRNFRRHVATNGAFLMNMLSHTHFQRGQALLMMSFAITAMFGIMALVVDVGWANYRKQAAQAAADSAAAAAVRAAIARGLNVCGDALGCYPTTPYTCPAAPPSIAATNIDSACMMAAANGFTTTGNRAVNVYANLGNPPSVNGAVGAYWVTVIVTETSASFFGPMVGGRLNPAARATAAQVSGPPGTPYVVAMVE